ncbi:MAG: DUF4062 domain-containing protein [Prevotellaceae bacterium]|nr:DUF4062 domain-containing protein [Candidatus Faecinaster equi]
MAKPRIFISSTFYDLKQIRVELDKFIESLGYEPIRNEEGDVPYDKDEHMQDYCYHEIANVDILISVIGGRFGSPSLDEEGKTCNYSITQQEIRTALEKNKLVYLFVDKNVLTEYETYTLNKSNTTIEYKYVDDTRIYKLIDEIKNLSKNNNIKSFETVDEIKYYLREQFAGLFKQYMLDAEKYKEQQRVQDINDTAKTLRELVDYLRETTKGNEEELHNIIKVNHPLVSRLKKILGIPYNFYIEGEIDLESLLSARYYNKSANKDEWISEKHKKILFIKSSLFVDGKLVPIKATEWQDDWVSIKDMEEDGADLPF